MLAIDMYAVLHCLNLEGNDRTPKSVTGKGWTVAASHLLLLLIKEGQLSLKKLLQVKAQLTSSPIITTQC